VDHVTTAASGVRILAEGSVVPVRVLPKILSDNEFFWTSGAEGVLRFMRCTSCQYIIHPPSMWCPKCLTRTAEPSAVSGRAILHSFTVNYHQWVPGSQPYVVGLVEIEEQSDVRLTTNIVGCAIDDVHIGMQLTVVFEKNGDVYLPLFEPAAAA
jgi:uncharacterized OB-fold protein